MPHQKATTLWLLLSLTHWVVKQWKKKCEKDFPMKGTAFSGMAWFGFFLILSCAVIWAKLSDDESIYAYLCALSLSSCLSPFFWQEKCCTCFFFIKFSPYICSQFARVCWRGGVVFVEDGLNYQKNISVLLNECKSCSHSFVRESTFNVRQ